MNYKEYESLLESLYLSFFTINSEGTLNSDGTIKKEYLVDSIKRLVSTSVGKDESGILSENFVRGFKLVIDNLYGELDRSKRKRLAEIFLLLSDYGVSDYEIESLKATNNKFDVIRLSEDERIKLREVQHDFDFSTSTFGKRIIQNYYIPNLKNEAVSLLSGDVKNRTFSVSLGGTILSAYEVKSLSDAFSSLKFIPKSKSADLSTTPSNKWGIVGVYTLYKHYRIKSKQEDFYENRGSNKLKAMAQDIEKDKVDFSVNSFRNMFYAVGSLSPKDPLNKRNLERVIPLLKDNAKKLAIAELDTF